MAARLSQEQRLRLVKKVALYRETAGLVSREQQVVMGQLMRVSRCPGALVMCDAVHPGALVICDAVHPCQGLQTPGSEETSVAPQCACRRTPVAMICMDDPGLQLAFTGKLSLSQ